jgi:hypothetical protein
MNRPPFPQGRGGCAARTVRRRLPPKSAVVPFVLLLFALAAPALAETWRFEAEDINPANCYAQGGAIEVVTCNDASGGKALEGLTMLGDWAEIRVTFSRETCLIDSIRCASPLRSSWQFRVEFHLEESADPIASNDHAAVEGRGVT